MPHQHYASQLREGLGDVEVAQRADLEEGHAQLLRVHLGLLRGHLPLVGKVEPVAHQDLRHPWCMLGNDNKEGKVSSSDLWGSVPGFMSFQWILYNASHTFSNSYAHLL